MPDIDTDLCYRRRGEVIDYLARKYGKDQVAQIITFGTLAARAVIRDVGRVTNMPLRDVDKIAKMVPSGPGVTLKKTLEAPGNSKSFMNPIPRCTVSSTTAWTWKGCQEIPAPMQQAW